MFLGIALVVGLLSEKRDLLYQELQKTNNAIKETEIKYKTVAEFAYDWETWEDETGQLKYISLACERTSGYTVNEFSENESLFASLILEEDQERWANHRHDIEFNKGIHSEQFRIRNKNGKIVWIEHTCRPVIDKNGIYLGYRANNRDITERKQAEEEIIESKNFLATLLESIPAPVFYKDIDGRYLGFNRAFEDFFGKTKDEMIGKSVFDINPVKLARIYHAKDVELFERPGTQTYETQVMDARGVLHDVVFYKATMVNFRGKATGLIGTVLDITDRKQAEEQLLKSEERYRTVFENTGTVMLVIEEDITISLANTEAEKLFGYSREELEGMKKWSEFITKEDLERIEEHHRLRIIDPASVPTVYEFNLINRQGAVRNISMLVAIIPGTKKSVVSLLDVTKRKEAERKLQEANQKLAIWVSELEERTAEMSQLSEMGEQLQSCQSIEEACAISAQYIQKLFPASQGALYLINPAKDLAEAVEMWGDSTSTEKMFMPLNCWAIRRGRPHLVDDSHPGLLCGHITGSQAGQYLCVPMMVHGEAMGILHLNHTAPEQDQQKSTDRRLYSEHEIQLALAVADQMALAIGNLRLRETLRQQSIRDILTGLFNRRHMEESLARELRRAEREKKPVGVIMFDIDHFKDFNDLFGHDGGDALLRELGAFLNTHTRGGDIVSRYGGEEFVSVFPGAALEDTRLRAEELRQGVKELLVYHLGKPLGKITISFGVAAFPEHGLTNEEILKKADTALYRAKSEGRDRVVVASTIG
ncbi:MAG: PAS domain S-box protein [Desulfotomaculaceae bacterium]